MRVIPIKKQWDSWDLPSRLTAIGTLIGVLSLCLYLAEKSFSLINGFSHKELKPVEVSQILVSISGESFRFEISLKNMNKGELLVKNISLEGRKYISGHCAGHNVITYRLAENISIEGSYDQGIIFKGDILKGDDKTFSAPLYGWFRVEGNECSRNLLVLNFNVAFTLASGAYTNLHITIPRYPKVKKIFNAPWYEDRNIHTPRSTEKFNEVYETLSLWKSEDIQTYHIRARLEVDDIEGYIFGKWFPPLVEPKSWSGYEYYFKKENWEKAKALYELLDSTANPEKRNQIKEEIISIKKKI